MANNEGSFRATAIIRVAALPAPVAGLRGKIFFLPSGAGGYKPGYYRISDSTPYVWQNFTELTVGRKFTITTPFASGEALNLVSGDASNPVNGASTTDWDDVSLDADWITDIDTRIELNGQNVSKGDSVTHSAGNLTFLTPLDVDDIVVVITNESL